ncbi:ParB/RepB/Spo0J family partition protein [uncultured Desulfosarcina sp.]|uniref:ParB/RepB/Spo0J family partition protein n=1 Tax=uncultured Desulfosarcina sp. TaxID=218289 RepID=UPI0029C7C193|nr:ParB/RepB/Spo0J family partition protein [uncultured Desulfosarcina sp.]
MDYDIQTVPLNRIDTADHTFKITTTSDKTDLIPSIRSVGILQPPVLIENADQWCIVCGFRRISASKALNAKNISAFVVKGRSLKQCARIAISDNAGQRSLNVVEQARAYALIRRVETRPEARVEMALASGLAASPSAMERIAPVAAMNTSLQEGVLTGSIALPVALQIDRLGEPDATALGGLLAKISAGLNVQRELLDTILDIGKRDGTAVADLIAQEAVDSILNNEEIPVPQRVQKLRQLLKRMRYPSLSQAEASFDDMLKALKLSPRLQIQPPRFFEGETYRANLSFDSKEQLLLLQKELDKLIRHPRFLSD